MAPKKRVEVKLFTLRNCKGCKAALSILEGLKKSHPGIAVDEINLEEHPEAAVKYKIMAAPTIIINGKKRLFGNISKKQIEGALKKL